MIQYTKIVLAYVESAGAATESAQAYVEIAAAYAESTRAAAESARVAIKAARTAQVEIMKMVEGKESSWCSWTFTSEQLVHCLYVIYMIDACELNFYVSMVELNFCFRTTSELQCGHLYRPWCYEDCYMTLLYVIG